LAPLLSKDIGEAMRLLHVIHWVHELQLSNVNFELDAKRVVDNYNKGKNDLN